MSAFQWVDGGYFSSSLTGFVRTANPADVYYQAAARLGQQYCDQTCSSGDTDSGRGTAWQHCCPWEQPQTSACAFCPSPQLNPWLLSTGNWAGPSEERVPTTQQPLVRCDTCE